MSEDDLEVSFKENAVEIKQEINEAKQRKCRRSSNTSLNCGENQTPPQKVGQNSKSNRDSGQKPGLKQTAADKENEKVAAVEIKQEIDEAEQRKSRRSSNTSLNCEENQNPLQEVGQISKSNRDSGKKPGLKQKVADKENENVAAVETKQEINEAKPRKSRRSANTSLNCGDNQNPLQEVGQNSKPDRDSGVKPGLKQTNNSLKKESATKTTKNNGKRKRGKKIYIVFLGIIPAETLLF